MIDGAESQRDLEIVAYHEVGHAVVAMLLGRPLWYIQIVYSEQARKWGGQTIREDLPKSNSLWMGFDLDAHIPYADLQFEYPNYPEPCDRYKIARELCVIDYAGIVAEELFYKQSKIDKNAEELVETSLDIQKAKSRIEQNFLPQDLKEELCHAKNHAILILSNSVIWRLVENIVENLMNYIVQSTEPEMRFTFESHWYFSHRE